MSTTTEFEREAGWHDDLIYALRLEAADPDAGDWRSNLVLDIDHIVEWLCGVAGRPMFKVAPATLTFHDVGSLRVELDFARSGFGDNIVELAIDSISKVQAPPPGADPTRPYWRWRIALNLPKDGEITFGASGYTLSLRAAPLLVPEQRLPFSARPRFPAV